MFLRIVFAGLWVVAVSTSLAQRLSPLAPTPDWTQLEQFQETITREEFMQLLDEVYAPGDAAKGMVDAEAEAVVIKTALTPPAEYRLRFAKDAASAKVAPRFWRPASKLEPAPAQKPLAGVKIALDAGHIGGTWARMEERWFQIGESRPVVEGEMTLRVAKMLVPKLQALGAEVVLVRDAFEPVTKERPDALRALARKELERLGVKGPRENYESFDDPGRGKTVQAQSELMFYRMAEIRQRAEVVNTQLKPDLVVCLHFNGEEWGEPGKPILVPRNHLHVLVNGCYSTAELRYDDQRFEMLMKLLSRTYHEEVEASGYLSATLAAATKLPPFTYPSNNAVRAGTNPYLWARNLLANRLYHVPVVFLEPYVMNSEVVWARVQAGDYEGELLVGGEKRRSIFREYTDAVVDGLREYYAKTRPAAAK